jgi:hypothetical protein
MNYITQIHKYKIQASSSLHTFDLYEFHPNIIYIYNFILNCISEDEIICKTNHKWLTLMILKLTEGHTFQCRLQVMTLKALNCFFLVT